MMKTSRSIPWPTSVGSRERGRAASSLALAMLATLLAPLGASLGPTGCTHTCTLAECSAGFSVKVDGGEGMDERMEPGLYVVVAEADGGVLEVECTFPEAGEGECDDGEWTTGPSRDLHAQVSLEPADEYDPSRGSAIRIHFQGSDDGNLYGPQELEITVTRDGTPVATATYTPEYEVTEDFNGEGCGDCAHGGGESLHVDPA